MGGSDQSSGDADKSPTHASQGLPSEKETDLNFEKNKNTKNNQPCQKDMMGASSQPFQSIWARIAYNVFNMDRKVVFIAKLPLILGGFFELG